MPDSDGLMTEWDFYEEITHETATYPGVNKGDKDAVTYVALGLAGEAGEVVDVIKKQFRRQGDMQNLDFRMAVQVELGDLLWYIARLHIELNIDFNDTMTKNVEKLRERKAKNELHEHA